MVMITSETLNHMHTPLAVDLPRGNFVSMRTSIFDGPRNAPDLTPPSLEAALPPKRSRNFAGADDELLDAYSKTIAAVVSRVAPSVVNIRVADRKGRPGGGSGLSSRGTVSL